MRKTINILMLAAGVVLCAWSGECYFNEDGESGGSYNYSSGGGSGSGSGKSEIAAQGSLLALAREIAAANQAKWNKEAAGMTEAERQKKYPEFIKENPVDVNLIYDRLQAEAAK